MRPGDPHWLEVRLVGARVPCDQVAAPRLVGQRVEEPVGHSNKGRRMGREIGRIELIALSDTRVIVETLHSQGFAPTASSHGSGRQAEPPQERVNTGTNEHPAHWPVNYTPARWPASPATRDWVARNAPDGPHWTVEPSHTGLGCAKRARQATLDRPTTRARQATLDRRTSHTGQVKHQPATLGQEDRPHWTGQARRAPCAFTHSRS